MACFFNIYKKYFTELTVLGKERNGLDVKVNYKKNVLFEICCLPTMFFYKFKFYTTNFKIQNKTFFYT